MLAQMMIRQSIATGHGDTVADLIGALEPEIERLRAERDAMRDDAERCDYIRRNVYRSWDVLRKAIDVDHPALWHHQFNAAIDAARKEGK
jgi:hypothetical protein